MHVGGRTSEDIDAGGVLPEFTGTLMRDGYAGQLWAQAMATTLLEANQAAHHARATGAEELDQDVLTQIRNHYLGALARGDTDNQGEHTTLANKARTLITRFKIGRAHV